MNVRQPSLFDQPVRRRPRKHTSQSQRDGLADVQKRAPTQDRKVLETLQFTGRLTRHELADITGLPLASVCRSVASLIANAKAREPVANGAVIRREGTLRNLVEAIAKPLERAG